MRALQATEGRSREFAALEERKADLEKAFPADFFDLDPAAEFYEYASRACALDNTEQKRALISNLVRTVREFRRGLDFNDGAKARIFEWMLGYFRLGFSKTASGAKDDWTHELGYRVVLGDVEFLSDR